MSSRGQIAARQRNITYRPTNQVAPHVLAATIAAPQLKGEVIHMRAGRSFIVNGLAVQKGRCACWYKAPLQRGRYYVCQPWRVEQPKMRE